MENSKQFGHQPRQHKVNLIHQGRIMYKYIESHFTYKHWNSRVFNHLLTSWDLSACLHNLFTCEQYMPCTCCHIMLLLSYILFVKQALALGHIPGYNNRVHLGPHNEIEVVLKWPNSLINCLPSPIWWIRGMKHHSTISVK